MKIAYILSTGILILGSKAIASIDDGLQQVVTSQVAVDNSNIICKSSNYEPGTSDPDTYFTVLSFNNPFSDAEQIPKLEVGLARSFSQSSCPGNFNLVKPTKIYVSRNLKTSDFAHAGVDGSFAEPTCMREINQFDSYNLANIPGLDGYYSSRSGNIYYSETVLNLAKPFKVLLSNCQAQIVGIYDTAGNVATCAGLRIRDINAQTTSPDFYNGGVDAYLSGSCVFSGSKNPVLDGRRGFYMTESPTATTLAQSWFCSSFNDGTNGFDCHVVQPVEASQGQARQP